jgi:hypothetical protein
VVTWAQTQHGSNVEVEWDTVRAGRQCGAGVAAGDGHGGVDTEPDRCSETETAARTEHRWRLDGTDITVHGTRCGAEQAHIEDTW